MLKGVFTVSLVPYPFLAYVVSLQHSVPEVTAGILQCSIGVNAD